MLAYTIQNEGASITCLRCGMTSWHPQDVEHLYCGKCHTFHAPAGSLYLTDPMYRLLNAIRHGDTDPTLEEGRPFTIRMWKALLTRKLVGVGPCVTGTGILALQAYENPS